MQVYYLVVLGTTIWVGIDAHNLGMRRGRMGGGFLDMGVATWVICCVLLWIIAFPCYLVARGRYQAMLRSGVQPYGAKMHPALMAGAISSYGSPVGQPMPYGAVPPPTVAAPPQLSPDGQWWWNGQEWTPVPHAAAPQ
jgi:hypothetical protein